MSELKKPNILSALPSHCCCSSCSWSQSTCSGLLLQLGPGPGFRLFPWEVEAGCGALLSDMPPLQRNTPWILHPRGQYSFYPVFVFLLSAFSSSVRIHSLRIPTAKHF